MRRLRSRLTPANRPTCWTSPAAPARGADRLSHDRGRGRKERHPPLVGRGSTAAATIGRADPYADQAVPASSARSGHGDERREGDENRPPASPRSPDRRFSRAPGRRRSHQHRAEEITRTVSGRRRRWRLQPPVALNQERAPIIVPNGLARILRPAEAPCSAGSTRARRRRAAPEAERDPAPAPMPPPSS